MKRNYFKINSVIVPLLLVFSLFGCCCPHHFVPKEVPEPLPPFFVPEKIRLALVLGGGGVRGMAHIGVLEVFEEENIPIDLIVGCSAGSIVGALYADNPNVDDITHVVWNIHTNSVLDIDLWNCRYGLSQGRALKRTLHSHLSSNDFEKLKIPLVIVASDLHSGELVTIGTGKLDEAIRASCSIPFVFVPCEYRGRILVDGGVINPVPVKVAWDMGAQMVVAVDLCELLEKTFPTNLWEVATRSAEIAFMWQNEVCTRSADVVIRPKTCGIGTFCDNKKHQLYEAGKQAAREKVAEIKRILATIPENNGETIRMRLVNAGCYTPDICLSDD